MHEAPKSNYIRNTVALVAVVALGGIVNEIRKPDTEGCDARLSDLPTLVECPRADLRDMLHRQFQETLEDAQQAQ